ncbi:hypothetical protein ACSQ6I_07060 [Anabaena sp. WFMT]|uniref:hypothetical protein n=1 Tax=Anabaena sp. WFMT TaxID=3449730 RepID=UPI003F227094
MQKPTTGESRGNCKKALLKANFSNSQPENQPLSAEKAQISAKICRNCEKELRLFCVFDTFVRTLHRACCTGYERDCPKPTELLKNPALNLEDKAFLKRLSKLRHIDKADIARLLEIEALVLGVGDE